MTEKISIPRLGVNVDHVATIRNARGGDHPDPVRAAQFAIDAGADGVTAHLREDRRHIRDLDIERIRAQVDAPLNLEMAATGEMVAIARRIKPDAACLVPERRAELTTEGGLNVIAAHNDLIATVEALNGADIRVSLFVDAEPEQIEAARRVGAQVVELHTGAYCAAVLNGDLSFAERELERLVAGAQLAFDLGLEVHAGHGLDYETVEAVAAIPQVMELNIGHFLVGEAIFEGLDGAVKSMKRMITLARHELAEAEPRDALERSMP